ncbi:SPRY domain-containing protein [Balamuthia mandrillaris]
MEEPTGWSSESLSSSRLSIRGLELQNDKAPVGKPLISFFFFLSLLSLLSFLVGVLQRRWCFFDWQQAVQANGSFRVMKDRVSFFEVTISRLASGTMVAVGCTTRDTVFPSKGALPGWLPGTHGFHSDDWSYFGGAGQPRASYPQAKRIQAGDTIGCGLTNGGELFFTVNSALVARAIKLEARTVCTPIIGVDGPGVGLVANFGIQPFRFDVNSVFDSEESYKTIPTGWSVPQEATQSTLKAQGRHLDNTSSNDNQQAVQGNAAFWILHNMVCFYEVTILRLPPKAMVAVGLTTKHLRFPAKKALPGWFDGTYGFHSDDWCYYSGSRDAPKGQLALAASGRRDVMRAGDTLGCGITNRGELFFTLNYDLVAVVERDMDRALPYVPVVGVCGKVELQTNFGSEGFVFDVGGMFRTAANCPGTFPFASCSCCYYSCLVLLIVLTFLLLLLSFLFHHCIEIYSPGQTNHLTDLPAEVLLSKLVYLFFLSCSSFSRSHNCLPTVTEIFDVAIAKPKDAISIGLVCKAFGELALDNSIWHRLFLQHWPQQNPNLKMRSWFKFFKLRETAVQKYGHQPVRNASGNAHPIENCEWELKCPLIWEQLKPDFSLPRDSFGMDTRRLCEACNEHVHYVTNQSELEEHVGQGHCVCIDFTQRRRPEVRMMGRMMPISRGRGMR